MRPYYSGAVLAALAILEEAVKNGLFVKLLAKLGLKVGDQGEFAVGKGLEEFVGVGRGCSPVVDLVIVGDRRGLCGRQWATSVIGLSGDLRCPTRWWGGA